jgi:molybdopterin-guanine dinucleotide biosynthesis protein
MAVTLADTVKNSKCLAIIGMEKNAGKTTVLNYLLQNSPNRTEAITSIGYDGEEIDQVTATGKPKIHVGRGTLVATARDLVRYCDFSREIMTMTGLHTPIGEVVVLRAMSDGYARIAGPSIISQTNSLVETFKSLAAERIIIDGAAARKSGAAIAAADTCILAAGAAYSPDIEILSRQTLHTVRLLTLPQTEDIPPFSDEGSENACFTVHDDKSIELIGDSFAEQTLDFIGNEIGRIKRLLFRGAVPSAIFDRIAARRGLASGLIVIAEDGTRMMISPKRLLEFDSAGIKLKVRRRVNLAAITVNPWSPTGFSLDSKKLCDAMAARTDIPVFDILSR